MFGIGRMAQGARMRPEMDIPSDLLPACHSTNAEKVKALAPAAARTTACRAASRPGFDAPEKCWVPFAQWLGLAALRGPRRGAWPLTSSRRWRRRPLTPRRRPQSEPCSGRCLQPCIAQEMVPAARVLPAETRSASCQAVPVPPPLPLKPPQLLTCAAGGGSSLSRACRCAQVRAQLLRWARLRLPACVVLISLLDLLCVVQALRS